MGMILVVMGACAAAMVALHMRVRRHSEMDVSAAAFLLQLPETEQPVYRWSFSAPLRSALFWLRLSALAALLLAVLSVLAPRMFSGKSPPSLGVWLIVDESYSMTGRDRSGRPLIEAAKDEARTIVEAASARTADGGRLCFLISGLGQRLTPPVEAGDAAAALQAVGRIGPRPEGADLGLIDRERSGLAERRARAGTGDRPKCRITHVAVISDQPRKQSYRGEPVLLWRQLEADPDNAGIYDVALNADPPAGTEDLSVRGSVLPGHPAPRIIVTGPDGAILSPKGRGLEANGAFWARFERKAAGRYEARIAPGGSYGGDDAIEFYAPERRPVAVDWRLGGGAAARRFQLEQNSGAPGAIVVSGSPAPGRAGRMLLVGDGFRGAGAKTEIFLFRDHPLLDAVNLDVLELAGPSPAPGDIAGSPDFTPIVQDSQGGVLVAAREAPRAVYIPGLPQNGKVGPADRAAAILLFNAMEWLGGKPSALALKYVTPGGKEILNGAVEWSPPVTPPSRDDLDGLEPASSGAGAGERFWRWFVVLCLALFAAERWTAARGEA